MTRITQFGQKPLKPGDPMPMSVGPQLVVVKAEKIKTPLGPAWQYECEKREAKPFNDMPSDHDTPETFPSGKHVGDPGPRRPIPAKKMPRN